MTGEAHNLIADLRRRIAGLEGHRASARAEPSADAEARPGTARARKAGLREALERLGYGAVAGQGEGRLVEVVGPRSCGKRSMLLTWMAERSREGLAQAWIDGVDGLEAPSLERLGFELERLLVVSLPREGLRGELFGVLSSLVRSGALSWVVADVGDAPSPGWRSGALSKLAAFARRSGVVVWLIRDVGRGSASGAWWRGVASLRLRSGSREVWLGGDGGLGAVRSGWQVERSRPPLPRSRYAERGDGRGARCMHLAGGAADPGVPR